VRRDDLGQPAGYGEAHHHQQGRHVDATGLEGKRLFLRGETCPGSTVPRGASTARAARSGLTGQESAEAVVCAERRVIPSWLKSSRTVPQAGSVAKGGGNASPGGDLLGGKEVMKILRESVAGQGAHREVGSEGFAAKRRAVAEQGEPVGQIQVIPSLHYGGEGNTWGAWTQQGVCGRHGGEGARVTSGGLVRSRPTGRGTWAYKPSGEVAGDAVREVGVTHGTQEPRNSKSLGTIPPRAGGRRPKRRRPGGRGHAGHGDRDVGAGE